MFPDGCSWAKQLVPAIIAFMDQGPEDKPKAVQKERALDCPAVCGSLPTGRQRVSCLDWINLGNGI